jgi:hypothetical protein
MLVDCGVAPNEIIDQVNFIYPAGVSTSSPYVGATLTLNGVISHFRVPAPLAHDQGGEASLTGARARADEREII